MSLEFVWPSQQYVVTGSDNGLAQNKQQAIVWTNHLDYILPN